MPAPVALLEGQKLQAVFAPVLVLYVFLAHGVPAIPSPGDEEKNPGLA
jgi:hypothetical protein